MKQIDLVVPEIPGTCVDFAKALGELADKYCLREVTAEVRVDTGVGSRYWHRQPAERVQETITVHVSKKDGRGRPRTQIRINADMAVSLSVVNEPDSNN